MIKVDQNKLAKLIEQVWLNGDICHVYTPCKCCSGCPVDSHDYCDVCFAMMRWLQEEEDEG